MTAIASWQRRKLPGNVERIMAVQSDLSGHTPDSAFDGYLTGYPLPEIRALRRLRSDLVHP